MSTHHEILQVLEKNGYAVTDEIKLRTQHFLDCLRDENRFHTLAEVREWFTEQRKNCSMRVSEVPLKELEKWHAHPETGNIEHDSGEFFTVIGVKVTNTLNREVVGGWTQPMIKQKEGGILGILCKNFQGVRHYLIDAKAEPGNIGKLQLSPTLQSTFSNLKKAHGGNKPKFAEYFEGVDDNAVSIVRTPAGKTVRVLYSRWLAEDGGRFYLKANKNMLVEVSEDEDIVVPHSFIWLTMYQIKQLLKYDNLVGPHVRNVLSFL